MKTVSTFVSLLVSVNMGVFAEVGSVFVSSALGPLSVSLRSASGGGRVETEALISIKGFFSEKFLFLFFRHT